jgi:hypothetical protein
MAVSVGHERRQRTAEEAAQVIDALASFFDQPLGLAFNPAEGILGAGDGAAPIVTHPGPPDGGDATY